MDEKFTREDLFRVGGISRYDGVYGELTSVTCPTMLAQVARFLLGRILPLYGEGYKVVGESAGEFGNDTTIYTDLPYDEAFNVRFPIESRKLEWDAELVDELAEFLV